MSYKDSLSFAYEILRRIGVDKVIASYDGYGDSGCIESLSFEKNGVEQNDEILEKKFDNLKNHLLSSFSNDFNLFKEEIGDSFQSLVDFIQDSVYSRLPAGFEINEGSFGDVVIDTETKKVEITQHDNDRFDIEEDDCD